MFLDARGPVLELSAAQVTVIRVRTKSSGRRGAGPNQIKTVLFFLLVHQCREERRQQHDGVCRAMWIQRLGFYLTSIPMEMEQRPASDLA